MTNALHGRSLNCAGGRTAIVAALRQAADLLSRSILSDADNNAANSVDSEGLAVARMLSCSRDYLCYLRFGNGMDIKFAVCVSLSVWDVPSPKLLNGFC